MTVDILLSQSLMLPSSYPTANTSLSVRLCAIAVTGTEHRSSRHRLISSPFFTSQHKTSSLAATMACPAPVPARSFAVHTKFDVLVATTPNDLTCSYFLPIVSLYFWAISVTSYSQVRFHHSGRGCGPFRLTLLDTRRKERLSECRRTLDLSQDQTNVGFFFTLSIIFRR